MLRLIYAKNDQRLSEADFNYYVNLLPLDFKNQVKRYQRWQDSQGSLFGKLLLRHILLTHQSQYTLNDVRLTISGRPYISAAFDFNITHSGEYVICAYSNESRVGIDLEVIGSVELSCFKNVLSEEEFEQIMSSVNQHAAFYTFWTIKEAAVKADGRGLAIPLKEVKVELDRVFIGDTEWFHQKIQFVNNYILNIVTDKVIEMPINLRQIEFPSFLKL